MWWVHVYIVTNNTWVDTFCLYTEICSFFSPTEGCVNSVTGRVKRGDAYTVPRFNVCHDKQMGFGGGARETPNIVTAGVNLITHGRGNVSI